MSEQNTPKKPKGRPPDYTGIVDLQTGKVKLWKNFYKKQDQHEDEGSKA